MMNSYNRGYVRHFTPKIFILSCRRIGPYRHSSFLYFFQLFPLLLSDHLPRIHTKKFIENIKNVGTSVRQIAKNNHFQTIFRKLCWRKSWQKFWIFLFFSFLLATFRQFHRVFTTFMSVSLPAFSNCWFWIGKL